MQTQSKMARKKKQASRKSQKGGVVPWVVDVKKGFEVTSDLVKALKKPMPTEAEGRKMLSRYQREYQAYKRKGGTKSYRSWGLDKGYIHHAPVNCCLM